jgi:hypothetical protein
MKKSTETYSKLVDIKDFPDLGGAPESLETTTLSDGARTYIEGIQAVDPLEFTANYDATDYATLTALKGTENDFSVWFGGTEAAGVVTPTGSAGKFDFSGYLSVYVTGAAVNEVVGMTITIIPSSAITKTST